jgi:hypothetical protein
MAPLEFYNGAYGLTKAKFIYFFVRFVLDTNTD